jgi:hypothetical protein
LPLKFLLGFPALTVDPLLLSLRILGVSLGVFAPNLSHTT